MHESAKTGTLELRLGAGAEKGAALAAAFAWSALRLVTARRKLDEAERIEKSGEGSAEP